MERHQGERHAKLPAERGRKKRRQLGEGCERPHVGFFTTARDELAVHDAGPQIGEPRVDFSAYEQRKRHQP